MITVAGFNTAIDKYIEVDDLQIGAVTRARNVYALPGGKGLHVALAVAALGEKVRLVGCVDARNQQYFEAFLERRGVTFHGTVIDELRTCLAIRDRAGRFTEILEAGPEIRPAQSEALTSSFLECCGEADVAVFSGSLPSGLAPSTYARLGRTLGARGIPCVVDTSGAALREAVAAAVFAIKPNRAEAAELAGGPIESPTTAIQAARQLSRSGVELVVVSVGQMGAVAAWQGRACHITPPTLTRVGNPVGAGDCLVAGLAVGLARQSPIEELLRLAVACGSAKVLCSETGLVHREDIERLLPSVELRWQE